MRPDSFRRDTVWTWNIRLSNSSGAVDADSLPSIVVYKNNVPTGESVTVTKPAATIGWYQCSFDPAGEAEHNIYSFVENVTIGGIAQAPFQWHAIVVVAERGTDGANTVTPPTTAQIEAALMNEGDGQALVTAIIQRIEADLDASDLSVAAIATACRNAILDRILSGNHDIAGSLGKLLQKLAVSGTLAHSDDAATYKATGFSTPADVTSARDAITGRLPAALIGGRIDASVGATQTDALSAAGLSAAAVLKIAAQITADHGSGSYVNTGSSGLSPAQEAVLNQIAARCALIVGAALTSAGPVTPGGRILLIAGNDHVVSAGSSLNRSITDPGAVLHARLTASGTTLQFGAGRLNASQQISGTISGVTHASGITTIALEITHSQIAATALPADDYVYQIQRRTSAGAQVIEVSGDLTLERRRVNRVS